MTFRSLLAALAASAIISSSVAQSSALEEFGPSSKIAAQRGPQIFNTVYDSLRKWGAVIHPNGMSLFLAIVPEGVMLHHGNNRNETPTQLDWLAYEIEHAEMFARARRPGPPGMPPWAGFNDNEREDLKRREHSQAPLVDSPVEDGHGWLHTYRTTRPLRFLYIDGMSGDKGHSGVVDTQDYLLRGVREPEPTPPAWSPKLSQTNGPPGEHDRALDLCQICADWGLQGVIRTEGAGPEIIKCDFFDGLEQIQSLQRSGSGNRPPHGGPPHRGRPGKPGQPPRTKPRDDADRYREIGSSRTLLDYPSMVSAYFFPVNLTNPDKEQANLPRLLSTTEAQMAAIKDYLAQVIQERYDVTISPFNWRDIADLVVHRYAPKIKTMVEEVNSTETMANQVRFLLEVFIDYSITDEETRDEVAEERCSTFYFQTIPLNTETDRMIYSAFKAVNAEICAALFKVRKLVVESNTNDESLEEAKSILRSLIQYLSWSVFE